LSPGSTWAEKEEKEEKAGRRVNTRSQLALLRVPFLQTQEQQQHLGLQKVLVHNTDNTGARQGQSAGYMHF